MLDWALSSRGLVSEVLMAMLDRYATYDLVSFGYAFCLFWLFIRSLFGSLLGLFWLFFSLFLTLTWRCWTASSSSTSVPFRNWRLPSCSCQGPWFVTVCACLYACMYHTRVHTYVCIYVCMYVCMYVYIFLYIYIYIHIYIYTYIHIYIYTYIYMYMCVHAARRSPDSPHRPAQCSGCGGGCTRSSARLSQNSSLVRRPSWPRSRCTAAARNGLQTQVSRVDDR
jgi:hypothetical protein